MTIKIRPETVADRKAIWNVNCVAFESNAEADLVDALRAGGDASLSLVAEVDDQIVGHIMFSTLQIFTTTGTMTALSLAPMAVLPGHQRRGIGSQLIVAGLDMCRQRGDLVVVVLGHPQFYPRFGFSAELAKSLESPFGGGEAWMALELVPDAMTGVTGRVEYAPPFGVLE